MPRSMRDLTNRLASGPGREYAFAVILLTVLGMALRLAYINQPVRYDEAFSYLFFVHVPLAATLSDYSVPNQHIFNSLLMRLSTGVFGAAPWALRLPAFMFGVAVIPVTYIALRRLVGAHAALLASAFVAVSSQQILFSTNARGYSLVVLLFLCAIGLSATEQRTLSGRSWKWLVAVSVMGLYAIPIMLYAIGGVWLWHGARAWSVWRATKNRQPLDCVAVHAGATAGLTALVYAPVLLGTGFGSLVANDWVVARSPLQFAAELPVMLQDLWAGWHAGMPVPMVIILGLGTMSFFLFPKSHGKNDTLILAITGWCAALLMITMRTPFPRVFLFLLPLYFAVAASGILMLMRQRDERVIRTRVMVAAVALSLWCGVSVIRSRTVTTAEGPLFPDAAAVVSYLATAVREGDGVYARTPADAPIWYYTWRSGLPDGMLRLKYNARSRILVVINESDGQSIEQVLAATPLPASRYTAPVLRRTFDRAKIYEIRRLPMAEKAADFSDAEAERSLNPVPPLPPASATSATAGAD